jgi:hypothetical protein
VARSPPPPTRRQCRVTLLCSPCPGCCSALAPHRFLRRMVGREGCAPRAAPGAAREGRKRRGIRVPKKQTKSHTEKTLRAIHCELDNQSVPDHLLQCTCWPCLLATSFERLKWSKEADKEAPHTRSPIPLVFVCQQSTPGQSKKGFSLVVMSLTIFAQTRTGGSLLTSLCCQCGVDVGLCGGCPVALSNPKKSKRNVDLRKVFFTS